jgi:hypothetical protein
MNFSRSDVGKVMNHANITTGWQPTNQEAQEVILSAIKCGVLPGVTGFCITLDGDFLVVLTQDGSLCTTTAPVSTRYLWRSGLTGSAAVRDMLDTVADLTEEARS